MNNSTLDSPESVPFETHARSAVQRLRATLAELFVSMEVDPARPQGLARQFGLDKSLSWRVSRVVTESDPLAAIPHVPGKSGLGIVMRTFRKAGAGEDRIEALQRAIDEFERMVELHAGDRDTLKMMLSGIQNNGGPQHDEAFRKLSYLGNGATWGVQARVQLSACFIAPSAAPGQIDLAVMTGLLGLRRLRSDVPWAIASVRSYTEEGVPFQQERQPLDPSGAGPDGAPIMAEFCSQPLPELRVAPGPGGVTRYEIKEGPIGNTATVTCVSGWLYRPFGTRYRTDVDRYTDLFVSLYTPVETLYHDLFVHRELTFAMNPSISVYSQLPGGPIYPAGGRECGLLPIRDPVLDLGNPPFATTADVPRYRMMIEAACRRGGWSPDDFHGFRFKLKYPPIPAAAVFRFELPQRP